MFQKFDLEQEVMSADIWIWHNPSYHIKNLEINQIVKLEVRITIRVVYTFYIIFSSCEKYKLDN